MTITDGVEVETLASPTVDQPPSTCGPTTFISPRAVALAWFVALTIASLINPAVGEPVQATTTLTVLANVGAVVWFATMFAGAARFGHTARLGMATGGLMLAGHLICGIEGHLPMTGAIWITQLMLIAGATAISGLAVATRR